MKETQHTANIEIQRNGLHRIQNDHPSRAKPVRSQCGSIVISVAISQQVPCRLESRGNALHELLREGAFPKAEIYPPVVRG